MWTSGLWWCASESSDSSYLTWSLHTWLPAGNTPHVNVQQAVNAEPFDTGSDHRQVVHTRASVHQAAKIGTSQQWCCEDVDVVEGLVESNGSLLLGLWPMLPVGCQHLSVHYLRDCRNRSTSLCCSRALSCTFEQKWLKMAAFDHSVRFPVMFLALLCML